MMFSFAGTAQEAGAGGGSGAAGIHVFIILNHAILFAYLIHKVVFSPED